MLVFKAINYIAPDYMHSKFFLAKNCHNHQTRGASKNRFKLPLVNREFGKKAIPFRAAKVLNNLPDQVTCNGSLLSFKTSIINVFGKF